MNERYVSLAPARSYSAFFGAGLSDAREVDLEHRVHVRRRAPARHHVLGDLPGERSTSARPGHRPLARRSGLRRLTTGAKNIVSRHTPAGTGPRNLRYVDAVLRGEPAHDGRQTLAISRIRLRVMVFCVRLRPGFGGAQGVAAFSRATGATPDGGGPSGVVRRQ